VIFAEKMWQHWGARHRQHQRGTP